MSAREEFIEIYQAQITRPGADALLEYLEHKSDFFTAPSSTRFHGCYEGGLCEHSLNVYHCLVDYLARERVQELYGLECSEETVAIVALLRSSRFNAWLSAGLGLVLGGALGNLVDRIRFRAVIDFVDVYVGQWHWPAFNVADMAICVGAFLACIVIWRTPEAPEKSKEKKS